MPHKREEKVLVRFPRGQKGAGSLQNAYSRPTEQAQPGKRSDNLHRTILTLTFDMRITETEHPERSLKFRRRVYRNVFF